MAATRIYRTFGSGNQEKWTFSAWVKRSDLGTTQKIFNCYVDGSNYQYISFNTSDQIYYYSHFGGSSSGEILTQRFFRDPNAWYNIVFIYDSGNAASGDRTQLWINGVRETSYSSPGNEAQPSLNQDGIINSANVHDIGSNNPAAQYFGGCMSHINFIDGAVYDASTFGSFNSTDGIWQLNTAPSVTYGTNGFNLKMEDTTNLDLDSSPNAHTFTTAGTGLTPTKDNPDNNFQVINPLNKTDMTFYNGDTVMSNGTSAHRMYKGSLGMTTGKWYWEIKCSTVGSSYPNLGIIDSDQYDEDDYVGSEDYGYAYRSDGQKYNDGSGSSYGDTWTSGDIIGVALDMDNKKLYFAKNGTWQDSGDPTSGATGTGAAYTVSSIPSTYMMASSSISAGSPHPQYAFNFGNGYFGDTVVTSEGTSSTDDDSIWEHDCPAGFYGLNTKNLGSFS